MAGKDIGYLYEGSFMFSLVRLTLTLTLTLYLEGGGHPDRPTEHPLAVADLERPAPAVPGDYGGRGRGCCRALRVRSPTARPLAA